MQQPANFAIDFGAITTALVAAVREACSLDAGRVVMAEPEVVGQPRPPRPFVTVKVLTPAARYGDDGVWVDDAGVGWIGGVRGMTVSFNCYGESHEEAYGYLALLQARLGGDAVVQGVLGGAGIAVWSPGAVADLSQLVNTAYEGRAHLDVTFGIASNLPVDLGNIQKAAVSGTVADEPVVSI